jgi:hypothetical protein
MKYEDGITIKKNGDVIIPSDSFFEFFKQAGFASNTRFGVPPVYAYGGGNDKVKGNAAAASKNATDEFRKNALALAQQLGLAPKNATVAPTTPYIYKAVAKTPLSFQKRIIPNYVPNIDEILTQEMQNNTVAADNTRVDFQTPYIPQLPFSNPYEKNIDNEKQSNTMGMLNKIFPQKPLSENKDVYPKSILSYDPNLGESGGYKLKPSAIHLLSLVSNVSPNIIENTFIQKRGKGHFYPFWVPFIAEGYAPSAGGGALTLGDNRFNSSITFTPNWFTDDTNIYPKSAKGNNPNLWLDILSHEVGHIPQTERHENMWHYLLKMLMEYALYGGHDNAPMEKEADIGTDNYREFKTFVDKLHYNKKNNLVNLLKSNKSEKEKIETINKWWKSFKNKDKYPFINHISN